MQQSIDPTSSGVITVSCLYIHRCVLLCNWFCCGIEYNNSYCHIDNIITSCCFAIHMWGGVMTVLLIQRLNKHYNQELDHLSVI